MITRELPPTTHVRVLSSAIDAGLERAFVGATGVIQRNLPTLKPAKPPYDWIVETLCIVDLDRHQRAEDGMMVTQLWLAPRDLEAVNPRDLEPSGAAGDRVGTVT